MAINQSEIKAFSNRNLIKRSINEVFSTSQRYAFLSHSHLDADLAKGLQSYLLSKDIDLYIDWQDNSLPSIPDSTTANAIKDKIYKSDFFIFLATENSVKSNWCQWEIGYADGKKSTDSMLILPTKDMSGREFGNEYMNIYKYINLDYAGNLAYFINTRKIDSLKSIIRPRAYY